MFAAAAAIVTDPWGQEVSRAREGRCCGQEIQVAGSHSHHSILRMLLDLLNYTKILGLNVFLFTSTFSILTHIHSSIDWFTHSYICTYLWSIIYEQLIPLSLNHIPNAQSCRTLHLFHHTKLRTYVRLTERLKQRRRSTRMCSEEVIITMTDLTNITIVSTYSSSLYLSLLVYLFIFLIFSIMIDIVVQYHIILTCIVLVKYCIIFHLVLNCTSIRTTLGNIKPD